MIRSCFFPLRQVQLMMPLSRSCLRQLAVLSRNMLFQVWTPTASMAHAC
ncbi:hypothetical protein [Escherichia coli]|nr:hypothetical protein [Escherichia coli]MEC5017036.1 hypothetical protein [Escherichia coli]